MDWFLYDIGLCHERIKAIQKLILNDPLSQFFKVVKIIKSLSFFWFKLAKKVQTAKILVFITFNHLIMIQYKISFKVRGHITIFGDGQVLTYWNIFPWGHGSQYLGFPTFWRGTQALYLFKHSFWVQIEKKLEQHILWSQNFNF